jgi:hypothetical protein
MRDIDEKWKSDSQYLPLNSSHRYLYQVIHKRSMERVNQFPNLVNPTTYNDFVNWCKLFDQCPEAVIACDKARVGEYAKNLDVEEIVRPIQRKTNDLMSIRPESINYPCVMKCNHDSGSYKFVNKQPKNFQTLWDHFKPRLEVPYGLRGGEWHYSMMKPCIIIEDNINPSGKPLADYKFHCVGGKVVFCQHIVDRGDDTKEINVDTNGRDLGFLFDENFHKKDSFDAPIEFDLMIEYAEILSAPFKYVRIDLYLVEGKIFLGEVTLHPRGGFYTGRGQIEVGKMMNVDVSTHKKTIWNMDSVNA